ncbi:MAG: T9SS type A sorting domain-containing protein [Bacteroidota bacterium]
MKTNAQRWRWIAVLLLGISVWPASGQAVDGRILLEADGDQGVRARIQLRAERPLHLGTSTLLLTYDPEVLAVPSASAANTFLPETDYTSRLPEPTIPGGYTLSASLFGQPGTLALSLDLLIPTFGLRVDTSWTAFADVHFVQLGSTEAPSVAWMPADAADPSVFFADDNATVLPLGAFADGTLPAPTALERDEQPGAFGLRAAYPNPFAHMMTVSYTIAQPGPVNLEVFDILGRRMTQLLSDDQSAGTHTVEWDGSGLANGVYLLRLTSDGKQTSHVVMRTR